MKRTHLILVIAASLIATSAFAAGKIKQVSKTDPPAVIAYFLSITPSKAEYPSARRAASVLTHICPTRVSIADVDGNVKYGMDNYIKAVAKDNGIAMVPLVTNGEFSLQVGHAILSDPAKRTRVVDQLLAAVKAWKGQGINIDLENIKADDRQNLNDFMQEMSDKFHAEKLGVTIDVAAKTSDAPTAYWAGCYDYAFLGKVCDMVMIMAYDEHWSGGHPGPVGSLPWVRKVTEYCLTVIPKEKLVLGVPFYGYDWPEGGKAKSTNCTKVAKLLADKKIKLQWDNIGKSHWFEYTDDTGVKRTVYFESQLSLKNRIALAQELKLAGISIWCLGNEDPEFWNLLAKYREGKPVLK